MTISSCSVDLKARRLPNAMLFRKRFRGNLLLGIAGWDDFIVRDSSSRTYRVPTVPLDPNRLTPFDLPDEPATLQPDARFIGKIKWYVKPIVFGGDPNIGDNLIWINHEQHAQLVVWWNQQYRTLTPERGGKLQT